MPRITCPQCGEIWNAWTDAPPASSLCPNCAARSQRMEAPRARWGILFWFSLVCLGAAAVAFLFWGLP